VSTASYMNLRPLVQLVLELVHARTSNSSGPRGLAGLWTRSSLRARPTIMDFGNTGGRLGIMVWVPTVGKCGPAPLRPIAMPLRRAASSPGRVPDRDRPELNGLGQMSRTTNVRDFPFQILRGHFYY
jgi:hypothetical protein